MRAIWVWRSFRSRNTSILVFRLRRTKVGAVFAAMIDAIAFMVALGVLEVLLLKENDIALLGQLGGTLPHIVYLIWVSTVLVVALNNE